MPDGAVAELTLHVEDFAGPDRWRWVLVAPDGEVLARHEVRLDPAGPRTRPSSTCPDICAGTRPRTYGRSSGTWARGSARSPRARRVRAARAALASALERGDHSAAATATSGLVDLCVRTGRLTEALALAGQGAEHARRAGLGTWSTLLYEVQRLHVLSQTDRAGESLAEADALHRRMRAVPRTRGPREGVDRWEVLGQLPAHPRAGRGGRGRPPSHGRRCSGRSPGAAGRRTRRSPSRATSGSSARTP
ncbi:hypothetical protein RB628_00110 [Streptomyces sp. ADMS]|uniref:hypothetical protein n=1 Tax=Streptomyces sp. ADMS TaxID=3071415 RepID=UPI00296F5CB0|nr:hypothetical protein [Streptomyces sp. ADMS]MDW4903787.1 hypothetical protein [Streptomyces sp. ADMS]